MVFYISYNVLQGEGVAYRGRIMVELSTKLEGKADKAVDGIPSDDILVAQVRLLSMMSVLCLIPVPYESSVV